MIEPSRKVPVLRLEWWRFAIVAVVTFAIFVVVGSVGDGKRSNVIEMTMTWLSLVSFLAYRFHRVRTDLASGRLSQEEFLRDRRAHFFGPKLSLILWLGFTTGAAVAFVFWRASTDF